MKQKITPFLWFNNNAEEAINFYTSIFKKSKIKNKAYYGKDGAKASGMPEGTLMTATFELNGQSFMAINGGPVFKFTEAISFVVNCKTQKEVDYYWNKLLDGGSEIECGWLKDKYGLFWQIVPEILGKLLSNKDSKKSGRVMAAMLQMKKINIEALKLASLEE